LPVAIGCFILSSTEANGPPLPHSLIIMSKQLLIKMLRKGSNGAEILTILDVITSDSVTDQDSGDIQPTLDQIDF